MSDEKEKVKNPIHPARQWWRMMTGWSGGNSANRGALANLRRCRKPVDALMVTATFNLMQRLPNSNKERVAVLAVVLAHIGDDDPGPHVARAVGRKTLEDEDSALLSESRFRRLLQSEGSDELLTNMVRLLRHMKGKANVADMAETILYWGDGQRRRWAFEYYAVGVAAPKANDNQNTNLEEAHP